LYIYQEKGRRMGRRMVLLGSREPSWVSKIDVLFVFESSRVPEEPQDGPRDPWGPTGPHRSPKSKKNHYYFILLAIFCYF